MVFKVTGVSEFEMPDFNGGSHIETRISLDFDGPLKVNCVLEVKDREDMPKFFAAKPRVGDRLNLVLDVTQKDTRDG